MLFRHATFFTQYEWWVLARSIKRAVNCNQYPDEDLVAYYKRWKTNMEIVDNHFGSFGPTKLPTGADQGKEHKKFQACLFLNGTAKKYTKVVDEFNNSYLNGRNEYPESAVDAVETLSYRMDRDHQAKFKPSSDDGISGTTSFAQTNKKNKPQCRKCGGTGHQVKDCPNEDSDDDDSAASGQSHHSRSVYFSGNI